MFDCQGVEYDVYIKYFYRRLDWCMVKWVVVDFGDFLFVGLVFVCVVYLELIVYQWMIGYNVCWEFGVIVWVSLIFRKVQRKIKLKIK